MILKNLKLFQEDKINFILYMIMVNLIENCLQNSKLKIYRIISNLKIKIKNSISMLKKF